MQQRGEGDTGRALQRPARGTGSKAVCVYGEDDQAVLEMACR